MSGREVSERLILKAELKNYKRWYFDCVKQLEQVIVKRVHIGDLKKKIFVLRQKERHAIGANVKHGNGVVR